MRDLLADLNGVAAEWPALWERDHEPTGFQWLDADDAEHSVYGFLRWGHAGASAVACVANFTPVPRPGYRVGLPWAGEWEVLVDTDAPAYGGSGFRGGEATVTSTTEIALAAPAGLGRRRPAPARRHLARRPPPARLTRLEGCARGRLVANRPGRGRQLDL